MPSPAALLNDREWVTARSRWRYWTWSIAFGWAAFLWIGFRARQWSWVAYGVVYAAPMFVTGAVAPDETDPESGNTVLQDIFGTIWLGLGVVALFHGRRLMSTYLARRAEIEATPGFGRTAANDAHGLLTRTGPAGDVDPGPVSVPHPIVADARKDATEAFAPKRETVIDVNSASEVELAALPGIGPIVAKRAIELQRRPGGFSSVDDFGHALGLKPHVIERLRPRLRASPRADSAPAGRRILDV